MDKSICRIGAFYDGSYFTYAQRYYYSERKLGWLTFPPLHNLIEEHIREKEQGYSTYRIVYSSWFQGMFSSTQSNDHQRRVDRNRQMDMIHAGIEPKYVPVSQDGREKGIDVALAVDALQVGLEGKIDLAVLVTGDSDFVPLVRALMKTGVRVSAVYFEYEGQNHKSFGNERLLSACNYSLNVSQLGKDKRTQGLFRGLFRQSEKAETAEPIPSLFPAYVTAKT